MAAETLAPVSWIVEHANVEIENSGKFANKQIAEHLLYFIYCNK